MLAIFIIFRLLLGIVMVPILAVQWIGFSVLGYHPSWSSDYGASFAQVIIEQKLDPDDCLSLRYVGYEVLPGFDAQPVTSRAMQDICLHTVADFLQDPMVCTKMTDGSQCVADIATKILNMHFDKPQNPCPGIECYNTNGGKTEAFCVDECNRFSNSQAREWCEEYNAVSKNDVSICDTLNENSYIREDCYFKVDDTCSKSAFPALLRACEARRMIGSAR
jgi:hypothetical protein